jgi:uncharacterized membrane protein
MTHGMPASYWSVWVFDANTDNFYALNDWQSGTAATDFLLMVQATSAPAGQMPVVTAPTSRLVSCGFARWSLKRRILARCGATPGSV